MSTIGTFKRKGTNFVGTVQTLNMKATMTFMAIDRVSDEAPDFRIISAGSELGAAWKRIAAASQREYLSVTLDDPSFIAPIYARLITTGEDQYELIWNRTRRGG